MTIRHRLKPLSCNSVECQADLLALPVAFVFTASCCVRPRATHMEDAYDFYKPNLQSEYPVVDGE